MQVASFGRCFERHAGVGWAHTEVFHCVHRAGKVTVSHVEGRGEVPLCPPPIQSGVLAPPSGVRRSSLPCEAQNKLLLNLHSWDSNVIHRVSGM